MSNMMMIKLPRKYIPRSLTKRNANSYAKDILRSRKSYKKGKYIIRNKIPSYRHRTSKHILLAKKIYDVENVKPSNELSKKTGCSLNAMRKIINKGEGAYYSSGSRPNQTPQSWGIARLASALTGQKSAAVDWHIIKDGCKKTGKAYKLALDAKKKHKYGTRRVAKRILH